MSEKCKKCGGIRTATSDINTDKDDITESSIPKYCMCSSVKGTVKPDSKMESVDIPCKEFCIYHVSNGRACKGYKWAKRCGYRESIHQAIAGEIVLDEVRFNEEIFDILNNGIDTADPKESITSLTYKIIKEVNRQLKQKLLDVKQ